MANTVANLSRRNHTKAPNHPRDSQAPTFKVGDTLHIYAFARQPHMTKLGEATVTEVHDIQIECDLYDSYVMIDGEVLTDAQADALAKADGFKDQWEMHLWFQANHGDVLRGQLIKW